MGTDCVWTNKKRGFNSYNMQQIKIMINRLIKEYSLPVSNLVLLQCIGIPMGIDPPPFWPKLYLHDYETDFIHTKIEKPGAFKFKNLSSFIDDECNLNGSAESPKSFHVIYPNELQLKPMSEHHRLHVTLHFT